MTQEKPDSGTFKAGLEDIVATSSNICYIDGIEGRLLYRGYDIAELAEHSTFVETAYLLWYGELPDRETLDKFTDDFRKSIELPEMTVKILELFPKTSSPMEVLRTSVSSLGHYDPDSGNTSWDACIRKAIRLTSRIPAIITAHERMRTGLQPIQPVPGESVPYNFLYTLQGKKPDPVFVKALDVALILHADHELNASTFAGRVTAATMADMYSSVTSAIGALKGPLHGGANERVMEMLLEIGTPARAETYIKEKRAQKEKIMGFGHRVYRTEDPRATVLRRYSEMLGKHVGDLRWYEISREVERVVLANTKVFPNVDFYSASCYYCMGVPVELFTPIFAMSRIIGWTAHILEQWGNNRLIRPRADYTGPPHRPYVPVNKRA